MKKRKLNLLIDIAIVCLCVCAIAIGVYSAKNANLNVSGSVGFNAHNCDVDVTAKIYGDSAESDSATANASEFGVPRTANHARVVDTKYVRGDDSQKIDIGQFYFCDMTDNDTISPIYIVLDLTNQSLFNIDCNVDASVTVNNTKVDYIKITKSPEITLKDKNATNNDNKGSLTITLELDQTTSIDTANSPNLKITLNMYKEVPKADLSTSWNGTGIGGLFNSSGYTLESDTQPTVLMKTNIERIKFTRDEPDSSYKKATGLNFGKTSTDAGTINLYAKASDTDSTLYDVVVYSESKIYPANCSSLFSEWTKLKTAIFDNFYTNNVNNMGYMFEYCSALNELDLSNFNTENVTIMSYMFNSCSKLINLDISNFNTQKVVNMTRMFHYCSSLVNLDISNWNVENVTSICDDYNNYGFLSECTSLKSVKLPAFNRVTNYYSLFSNCKNLKEIDLALLDTSNVTNMTCMFYDCSSLISLDLSHFNTSEVTNMSNMFYNCQSLISIDLSHFDTSKVTDMQSMFYNCKTLSTIDVSGFDTSQVTSMRCMFQSCGNVISLDLSSFKTQNLTEIHSNGGSSDSDGDINWRSLFSGCNKLEYVNLSNWTNDKLEDMSGLFSNLQNLKRINLTNFRTPVATNMSSMFESCKSLEEIDLSSFDTSNVIKMNDMFIHCESLTYLDLTNFNTNNVQRLVSFLSYCINLKTIDLSSFNTEKVTSMNSMFLACKSLTILDLSNFKTSNVLRMSSMFQGCSSLVTIYVGSSWDINNVTDTNLMFRDCYKLVGGNGTVYDSSKTDKTYACIDGSSDADGNVLKGYLTLKTA